jgi:TPR repeat protein
LLWKRKREEKYFQAIELYLNAAELESVDATYNLEECYEVGNEVREDHIQAFKLDEQLQKYVTHLLLII